ncbi:TIP41-like family-domain-containing protein [Cladochytrium replicatum]|nr:TIP41-like family-domain-containing protein [Cladochytrium replicatum]
MEGETRTVKTLPKAQTINHANDANRNAKWAESVAGVSALGGDGDRLFVSVSNPVMHEMLLETPVAIETEFKGTQCSTEAKENGIRLRGWEIVTRKGPIFNATELDYAAENSKLNVPYPEMFFGHNRLNLKNVSKGFEVEFNAIDALRMVVEDTSVIEREDAEGGVAVKVSYADHWTKKNAQPNQHNVNEKITPYDWTYTTEYTGTVISSPSPFIPTPDPMDVALLRRQDPILFYDELILYEDELADNGSGILSVRVRVMPTCFLILGRYFLRVDKVLFRVLETRVYHCFDDDWVLREYSWREEDYDTIKQQLRKPHLGAGGGNGGEDLTMLTDPNWVASTLPNPWFGECLPEGTEGGIWRGKVGEGIGKGGRYSVKRELVKLGK